MHSRWQLKGDGVLLAGSEGRLDSEDELVVRLDDEEAVFKRVE